MKKTEHRHQILIHWSDEDQAYIAEVPELEWCAADGATSHEAVGNVEVIIDEWIATAKENGWTIPEPKAAASCRPEHYDVPRADETSRPGHRAELLRNVVRSRA